MITLSEECIKAIEEEAEKFYKLDDQLPSNYENGAYIALTKPDIYTKAGLTPIRWCQQNGLDILNQIEVWVKDNEYIDNEYDSLIGMIGLLNKIEELKTLTINLHPIH